MLIFVLTCAFVIIVTVAIDTFRSEAPLTLLIHFSTARFLRGLQVIAALDTGTSFIVTQTSFDVIFIVSHLTCFAM